MTPSSCKSCGEPVMITAAEFEAMTADAPTSGKEKHWKRWLAKRPKFDGLCAGCRDAAKPKPAKKRTKNQQKSLRRKMRGAR